MKPDETTPNKIGQFLRKPVVAGQTPMSRVDYLLSHLAQECCEVAIRCTKAQHFGLDEVQPEQAHTNRERLLQEVFDLMGIVEILRDEGVLPDFSGLLIGIEAKKVKAARFSSYSRELGRLL